jgi:YVTN family beta-propeller protein
MKFYFPLLAVLLAIPMSAAAAAQRLPTGQILRPTGLSVPLGGTLAMGVQSVPGTDRAVTVCSGERQALTVVDTKTAKTLSVLPYQTLDPSRGYTPTGSVFFGLALAPDHSTLYAARGSEDKIGIYHLNAAGQIAETGTLDEPTGDPQKFNFPAGIALNGPGSRLYAAGNTADTLAVFDVPRRKLLGSVPVGSYPLAVAALPDGSKVYVSSERDSEVTVVDPQHLVRRKDIPTGAHPDALLLSSNHQRLYVANGDGDTVSVIGTASDMVLHTIVLRPMGARGLPGATPTGLALSPDGRTLYVSLADMNAVAVVGLTAGGSDGLVRGYIPTGWYPTGVAVSPDGERLLVTNGKGSTAQVPNPKGPGPFQQNSTYKDHNILEGTLSLISVPEPKVLAAQTRQVLADNSVGVLVDADSAAVEKKLKALPITHVIYIIKENRTYDQVLGDLKEGNGDSALTLFGQSVTPNLHALAQNFVLLDNFYDCAEVSPDGWNWSTSGLAEEYTQRTVPENYGERRRSARPSARTYDYEGENRGVAVSLAGKPDVAESPGGYIWDAVARRGLSYRNYGSFLTFDGDRPTKPALTDHTCPDFSPFNMKYADSDAWVTLGLPSPGLDSYGLDKMPSRYTAWKQEFDGFVKNGGLPAFELVRMPRDHTAGTAPGNDSPLAMAADNDYGVGEIVQAVSHSPYWKNTAIFVVEDDAQNGPDHVDCHRSTAYVLSAYTQRRGVDHHFYNTDSLLRTMEILLRVPPMTRLDAAAPPLRAFSPVADLSPFTALAPDKAILAQKNTRDSYGAERSRRMNFAIADDAPDDVLNEILWRSIKGAHAALPPIRRGALSR